MTAHILTQDELKTQLHYNPETGIFTRLVSIANCKIFIGDVAGSLKYTGYVCIKFKQKPYQAHRLAWLYMTGSWPKEQIDHINGIKNDNRWNNLREATTFENNRNCKKRKDNASGYKGVSFRKDCKKWTAYARSNNKHVHLGTFNTIEIARNAYKSFAQENYGEFFREE